MTTELDELDTKLDGSWTRPLDASSYSGRRRTCLYVRLVQLASDARCRLLSNMPIYRRSQAKITI